MINVAAIRMKQFGVQFYQASLSAGDIDKLVRFEVLNYGESGPPVRGGKKKAPSKVNWDLLERRIASSEKAYQRQIIRKKIVELVQYYEQCRQARDLPSIAGAVIISCDEKLTFEPVEAGASIGRLKVPEREGILRAIDGQHGGSQAGALFAPARGGMLSVGVDQDSAFAVEGKMRRQVGGKRGLARATFRTRDQNRAHAPLLTGSYHSITGRAETLTRCVKLGSSPARPGRGPAQPQSAEGR